ncbi:FAD/NAD(P)-binding domain-containing protein [Sistotremastrum suecicum HHB10207 ss-3]|uniref:FAD/NAD(P)-binding domain-containing protein n=1 Tax=Sistotremastrum suecicum HHB10207 ss-3 TaxID=1314776 RepID=A0A166DMQ8_9AGAM|nr:FAD/NAD(P)-binding domain-containing protein [Sistotremastrum suecicum HHB10207 ss-3]
MSSSNSDNHESGNRAAQVADKLVPSPPPSSFEKAYFTYTADKASKESAAKPFDIAIIGSGIGGGVVAAALQETIMWNSKNKKDGEAPRILLIERGGLLFHSHCLNAARPTKRGGYGQHNNAFYNRFKSVFKINDLTELTEKSGTDWRGGPLYCLGGRSPVWGLFIPRIHDSSLEHFPKAIATDLLHPYYEKAEKLMHLSYPDTRGIHQLLMDRLNMSKVANMNWQWGRIASEFKDEHNYDFAEGAYSTVDKLLELAMNDPEAKGPFKILLNTTVQHLLPEVSSSNPSPVEAVVVTDAAGKSHEIKCKKVVLSAGSVNSAAILLRSAKDKQPKTYGNDFGDHFGHITDHEIYHMSKSFVWRNPEDRAKVGAMKLQTYVHLPSTKDIALANISLDASSFLPRGHVKDDSHPQFIMVFMFRSDLQTGNSISLDDAENPQVNISSNASDKEKEEKDKLRRQDMVKIVEDTMRTITGTLGVQFLSETPTDSTSSGSATIQYTPLDPIALDAHDLLRLPLGAVGHELGSIPFGNHDDKKALIDTDLKLKYGYDGVYVCDLSIFPFAPAANPTLTLAALALRLSDHLMKRQSIQSGSINIHNLTTVTVEIVVTDQSRASAELPQKHRLPPGGLIPSLIRLNHEVVFVYEAGKPRYYDVLTASPGHEVYITRPPYIRD